MSGRLSTKMGGGLCKFTNVNAAPPKESYGGVSKPCAQGPGTRPELFCPPHPRSLNRSKVKVKQRKVNRHVDSVFPMAAIRQLDEHDTLVASQVSDFLRKATPLFLEGSTQRPKVTSSQATPIHAALGHSWPGLWGRVLSG